MSPLCFKTRNGWCRNFDLLSIAYALRLRLRTDLPYVDRRCVGNLGLSASGIFTRIYATHAGILTSARSTTPYSVASLHAERSPTSHPDESEWDHGFGDKLEPRYIVGAESLDQ